MLLRDRHPHLYQEFAEGGVPGFVDELDLLRKTPAFWEFTQARLAGELGGVAAFGRDHFRERWDIDRNVYLEAIELNIRCREFLLKHHADDYRPYLDRRALTRLMQGTAA